MTCCRRNTKKQISNGKKKDIRNNQNRETQDKKKRDSRKNKNVKTKVVKKLCEEIPFARKVNVNDVNNILIDLSLLLIILLIIYNIYILIE